jgi:DNA-directed RNA polymerase subunit omega
MIEALKGDVLVRKVGGRFKLAVLLQKRMVDVAFGAPILVDASGLTTAEAVVQEVLQDKICLDMSGGMIEVSAEAANEKEITKEVEPKDTSDED